MSSVPPSPPRKPGRVGFWVGGLLVVAGIIVGIAGVATGVNKLNDVVDSYQRVPVASGGTIKLDEAGTYNVFLERPGIDEDGAFYDVPSFRITDVEGHDVPLQTAGAVNLTYSFGDRDGRRIGKVVIARPGTYRVQTVAYDESSPGLSPYLAIGKGDPIGSVVTILVGVFAGGALMLAGIVVLIVSGVRRGRANRVTAAYPGVPGWGAPPGGGWVPPPGGAGWAPPPTSPPGGPAPGWAPPPPAAPSGGPAPGWAPPPAPSPPPPGGWAPPPAPGSHADNGGGAS